VLRALVRAIDAIAYVLVWVACIVTFLMMAHVTADVTMRFALRQPLAGTLEIVSGYYMVIVIFLPLAFLARSNGHILVELFTRRLPARRVLWLDAIMGAITLVYMAALTWMAGIEALRRTREGEVWSIGFTDMVIWPSRWVLVVGAGLMALAVAVGIAENVRRALRRGGTSAPAGVTAP
jgi:TRAP-type C4-dicarboxylate transport system permease small subunit